jgi:hypothetical protein
VPLIVATAATLSIVLSATLLSGFFEMGFTTDGIVYVDLARHVAAGEGLTRSTTSWFETADARPNVYFPPTYPLLLGSLSAVTQLDPTRSAAVLSVLLYAVNMVLVGGLTWTITRHRIATAIAMVTIGLSKTTLIIHAQALSEPLYAALILGGLWFMIAYGRSQRRSMLCGAAACIGFALVTRYQGLFLGPTFVLLAAWLSTGSWRKRSVRALMFGSMAIVPYAGWIVRNAIVAPAGTIRHYTFMMPTYESWWWIHNTMGNWFTFRFAPQAAKLAVLVVLGIGIVVLLRAARRSPQHRVLEMWIAAAGTVFFMQLGFVIVASAMLALDIPFDDRIFSSNFILAVITVCAVLTVRLNATKQRLRVAACTALMTMMVTTQLYHAWRYVNELRHPVSTPAAQLFEGYASDLSSSAVVTNHDGPVFSNAYYRFNWTMNRPVKDLPRAEDTAGIEAFVDIVRDRNGLIVFFAPPGGWRPYLLGLEHLNGSDALQCQRITDEVFLFTAHKSEALSALHERLE